MTPQERFELQGVARNLRSAMKALNDLDDAVARLETFAANPAHVERAREAMADTEREDVAQDDRLLLSVAETARLCGVGRNMVYEMARRGEWPTVRIGSRVLISRVKLLEWIDQNTGQWWDV